MANHWNTCNTRIDINLFLRAVPESLKGGFRLLFNNFCLNFPPLFLIITIGHPL